MTKINNTKKEDNGLVRLKAPSSFKGNWVLSDKFGREPVSPQGTVDVSRRYATELMEAEWSEIGPTPALDVESYMIEPMTRPGESGYVPLSSALLWIMTKRGSEKISLTDAAAWDLAVTSLLPLMETKQVKMDARPKGKIKGYMVSGVCVAPPLSDFVRSDGGPWIWTVPFVGSNEWDRVGAFEFNDQLFLGQTAPAFTHLRVRKSDMLREFEPTPAPKNRGGRPQEFNWESSRIHCLELQNTGSRGAAIKSCRPRKT